MERDIRVGPANMYRKDHNNDCLNYRKQNKRKTIKLPTKI